MFEDRGNRIVRRIGRHPDARRQPAPVRHDDADVGMLDDRAREGRDGLHGRIRLCGARPGKS